MRLADGPVQRLCGCTLSVNLLLRRYVSGGLLERQRLQSRLVRIGGADRGAEGIWKGPDRLRDILSSAGSRSWQRRPLQRIRAPYG